MRPILLAAAALLFAPFAAQAKSWSVSCAGEGCVAIDDTGNMAFIDMEKQTVVGVDKLTDNPQAPFVISCTQTGSSGCVVVDGAGKLWFGPPKPGTPYKAAPNAKLP